MADKSIEQAIAESAKMIQDEANKLALHATADACIIAAASIKSQPATVPAKK